MKVKKSQESTTNEEDQYLSYTINCEKFVIVIKDNAQVKNFRVMSGQPTPPPKPQGEANDTPVNLTVSAGDQ